jgi:hypothetical protein
MAASTRRTEPWLAWAVAYSVAVATGASGASPPFPPLETRDPVVAFAARVVETELALAGRPEEASLHHSQTSGPRVCAFTDLTGIFHAVAFVLEDRGDEAQRLIEKAARMAETLEAPPVTRMAQALTAELSGDLSALPPAPACARDLSDLLVLRARAVHDPSEAICESLTAGAKALGMPGLLAGV